MTKFNILNNTQEPWYKDGLRFKCTGCGKCCTGAPGFVFLTEEDIQQLLQHLKISKEEFVKRYTKSFNGRLSLRDDLPNYSCIFLKDGKFCQVYNARPLQCKTYPYWLGNISSESQWMEESARCEGINHPDAPWISKEHIERIAAIHAGLIKEEP
jgi:Fe-S-cluster containining protein